MKRVLAALCLVLLPACSGASRMLPPTTAAPAKSGHAALTITMSIPKKNSASAQRVRPAYISSSTQSATYTLKQGSSVVSTSTQNYSLSSPNCSWVAPNLVCTTTLDVAPGNYTTTIKTYDQANGTGNVLSQSSQPLSVVVGRANVFSLTLNPVLASWKVELPIIQSGTASTNSVPIATFDPSGAQIIGSDSFVDENGTPVSLKVAVTSEPAFSLTNGTVTTGNGGFGVQLSYDGSGTTTPDLTFSETTTAGTMQNAVAALPIMPLPTFASFTPLEFGFGTASLPETFTIQGYSTPSSSVIDASSCAPETFTEGTAAGSNTVYSITAPIGTPSSCVTTISAPWATDPHADGLAALTANYVPSLVIPLTTGPPYNPTDVGASIDRPSLTTFSNQPSTITIQPAYTYTGPVGLMPVACLTTQLALTPSSSNASNVVAPANMGTVQTVSTGASSTLGTNATVTVTGLADGLCEYQSVPAPAALGGKAANVWITSGGY